MGKKELLKTFPPPYTNQIPEYAPGRNDFIFGIRLVFGFPTMVSFASTRPKLLQKNWIWKKMLDII